MQLGTYRLKHLIRGLAFTNTSTCEVLREQLSIINLKSQFFFFHLCKHQLIIIARRLQLDFFSPSPFHCLCEQNRNRDYYIISQAGKCHERLPAGNGQTKRSYMIELRPLVARLGDEIRIRFRCP